jgi:hypothetical protein
MVFAPRSSLDAGAVSWEPSAPVGSVDWMLDAVRRRDERIRLLNAPEVPPEPEAEVGEAPVVVAKTKKPSELQRAKAFLVDTLREPVLATTVEKLAVEAGISKRTLRRAGKALKVKSRRKGNRGPWFWSLIQAEPREGQS